MKQKLMNIFLVLLPVMAVALATTVDSVTVFDKAAGTTACYSYFSLIPGESMQMLPPTAAVLCGVAAVLSLLVAAGKKDACLGWIKWISMGAAVAAVMPILRQDGDTLVVPSVVLPLLMLVECALAAIMAKAKASGETARAKQVPESGLSRKR